MPQALTNRVAWRLARPAQVAVDFKGQVGVIHGGVLTHKGLHVCLVPDTGAIGHLLAQVKSDINNHAGSAQALGIQKAHAIARVIHVAQFSHERLSIQSPAFAVA